MSKHFLAYLEESIKSYWDKPVMSDIDGDTRLTYASFSNEIYRLHVFFDSIGVQKGDKIALCSGNCANWALSFMAVAACQGVVVSILPDFKPESIHSLVNHSEAKLLIVNPRIFATLKPEEMPALQAIISMKDFSLLASKTWLRLTTAGMPISKQNIPMVSARKMLIFRKITKKTFVLSIIPQVLPAILRA